MAYIRGNNAGNSLYGTAGSDRIAGYGGNDSFYGRDGADKMFGGNGKDSFYFYHYSASDVDQIFGNEGDDRLSLFMSGETQDIVASLDGGFVRLGGVTVLKMQSVESVSSFNLGAGNDYFAGGAFADSARGGDGNDRLMGRGGNDSLSGLNGDDVLFGDEGKDYLFGDSGNDVLQGGVGRDTMLGDLGTDRLIGGLGEDSMIGGEGHDRFVWNSLAEGGDRIPDFQSGQDRLLFQSDAFGGVVVVNDSNFIANGIGAARDEDDRFLYSNSTQALFFDADGTGEGQKILIGHIYGDAITAADILMF
ncbi:MAG: calcium-binding protein [Pseudomonadota bacterium]